MWFRRRSESIQAESLPTEADFIAGYLKDPVFKDRIRSVAMHSGRLGLEGGFAVYRDRDGNRNISQAILPSSDWWLLSCHYKYSPEAQTCWDPRRKFPSYMLTEHYYPKVSRAGRELGEHWRQDPRCYDGIRTDIGFFLHSHPNGCFLPSPGDISSWSKREKSNSSYTNSILTTHGSLIKILFWRRSEATQIQCPPDLISDTTVIRETKDFFQLCERIGAKAIVAKYSWEDNQFYPGATAIAKHLTQ